MLISSIQQFSPDKMFLVDFCGEKKKFFSTSTYELFQKFKSSTNGIQKNLSLVFNSVYIDQTKSISLIDIGYSPTEYLQILNLEKKKTYFRLSLFDFQFSYEDNSKNTVFNAKCYFAKFFYTVPRNIVIEYQGKKLLDDEYLINYDSDESSPFELSIKKGYHLYYTFTNSKFSLICLKEGSTLRNLRDTITVYTNLYTGVCYGQRIKKLFNATDQIIIENTKLEELTQKTNILDIDYFPKELKEPIPVIPIKIDNSRFNNLEVQIFDPQTTVYMITIFLEKQFQIDRSLFIPHDKTGKRIDLNTPIIEYVNNPPTFSIEEPLFVKLNGRVLKMHYLSTIEDIHNKKNFNAHNFGIIINNQFANNESGSYLLAHFLNNPDIPSEATEIKLKFSLNSCHIKTISRIEPDNKIKSKRYIVPDYMKFEDIATFFMNRNPDTFHLLSIKDNVFTYEIIDKRKIFYNFEDDSNSTKACSITVDGRYARVIDLFKEIHKENRRGFHPLKGYKDYVYEAYFNNITLKFWELLTNILYTKENPITVKAFLYQKKREDSQKDFKVQLYNDGSYVSLPFDFCTAKDIIKNICKTRHFDDKNVSLFMNYNLLNPTDIPTLCKNGIDTLFLGNIPDKKSITVTNETTLRTTIHANKDQFDCVPQMIIGMFGIKDEKSVTFKHRTKNSFNGQEIPSNFNLASFPNEAEIIISCPYNTSKEKYSFTFLCDGQKKKISLPSNYSILNLKDQIQEKLNKFDSTINSLSFEFNKFKLDESKKFTDYKLFEDAVITVSTANSFEIQVKLPEKSFKYKVAGNDTIGDVKRLIKSQFNYDDEIQLKNSTNEEIDDKTKVSENMSLLLICKKAKLKCQGLSNDQNDREIEVSEILTVSEVTSFLRTYFFKGNFSIFTLTDKVKQIFQHIDKNKKLFEIDSDLFVHRVLSLSNVYLDDSKISVSSHSNYSDQNTLEWFKQKVLSRIIMKPADSFELVAGEKRLDEYKKMADIQSIGQGKIRIQFDFDKPLSQPPSKPSSSRRSKPKIKLSVPLDSNDQISTEKVKETENKIDEKSEDVENKIDETEESKEKLEEIENIEKVEENADNSAAELNAAADGDAGKRFTYKFQIDKDPVCTMSFGEGATINDARIEIAKQQGDIDPSCVSILFAGKVLRKDILIENLNLIEIDILQVCIKSVEDIFLRTARALRVYGQADLDEYYSEYEEYD
ncbi:hypothetical protein M9Y10_015980 [Tritrichomonas musculus]|uniref:Ubiquitin-like domain-containing protein n=1 Tax=Tritrichomonas musculus TaxID=1915356 RepID=A0ABR2I6P9_9EUKA